MDDYELVESVTLDGEPLRIWKHQPEPDYVFYFGDGWTLKRSPTDPNILDYLEGRS